jgi:hypothetical protein
LTKLLSKVCALSDFCMLHYIMGYYFLHQETYEHFDERCKRYEAQLEEEGLHHREIHNVSTEEENVWREIDVSCLQKKILHYCLVLCDRNM